MYIGYTLTYTDIHFRVYGGGDDITSPGPFTVLSSLSFTRSTYATSPVSVPKTPRSPGEQLLFYIKHMY